MTYTAIYIPKKNGYCVFKEVSFLDLEFVSGPFKDKEFAEYLAANLTNDNKD